MGKDPGVLADVMNRALDVAQKWCSEVGLSINPCKTDAVYYTFKNNIQPKALSMGGSKVEFKTVLKYLGVWLDYKLSWSYHCQKVSQKCLAALSRCRRIVGPRWGLAPKIMRWVYTAIVRPALLYGAVVWCTSVKNNSRMKVLRKVQRAAGLAICSGLKSTPTDALECISGLRRVETILVETAVRTRYRLQRNQNWLNWENLGGVLKRSTHLKECEAVWKQIPALELPCDHSNGSGPWELPFIVHMEDREWWNVNGTKLDQVFEDSVLCFTDGSKQNNKAGASYVIPQLEAEGKFYLGTLTTVFQSEIYAITMLIYELLEKDLNRFKNVCIFTDSLSALQVLQPRTTGSALVTECLGKIVALSRKIKVNISWIPAHSGYEGNEKADK